MAVVLAGYDGDQDPLIYKVVTQPSQGVLTGTPPNLSYQANDNAAGSDRFTYRVNDGLMDSGLATVRISIGEKSTMGVKTFDGSAITFEVRGANGALLEVESGSSLGIWTPTAIQVLGRGRDIPVPVNFPIVLDSEGQNLKAWSVFAFPTSYVVDKKGRMRLGLFGSIEWDSPEAVAKLEALLAEPD